MAPRQNFLIDVRVDLSKTTADLKRFEQNTQRAAKKGITTGAPQYDVPQIPRLPAFPATSSPKAIGANLAAAQRQFAVTQGLEPGSRQARDQFRASDARKQLLSQYDLSGISDKEISGAQAQVTQAINERAALLRSQNVENAEQRAVQEVLTQRTREIAALTGQEKVFTEQVTALKQTEAAQAAANAKAAREAKAAAERKSAADKAAAAAAEAEARETAIAATNTRGAGAYLDVKRKARRETAEAALAESRAQQRAARAAERDANSRETKLKGTLTAMQSPGTRRVQDEVNRETGRQQQRAKDQKSLGKADQLATTQSVNAQVEYTRAKNLHTAQVKKQVAQQEALSQQDLRAQAQSIVAEKKRALQLQKLVKQEALSSGLGRFQAGQLARGAAGSGGPGAGGFFTGGALSTLRYALPSAALFGGAAFLTQGVKEAEELNRAFVTLEAQLKSIGNEDAVPKLREDILSIARDTGIAADEIADLAIQIQGAFGETDVNFVDSQGGQVTGSQQLVEQQLDAAAKLTRVSGLTKENVVNDLTAASFAFESTGERIGDVSVKIQDDFGVAVNETLNFLGQIGPVAQEAGFSLEEFAVISALVQQRSGRSGAALAESFGRIIPQISSQASKLQELASRESSLQTDEFLGAIANNDVRTVFLELATNFDNLSESSQDFVINLLGGRREAQALIPAFAQAQRIQSEAADVAENSAGLLDKRFSAVAETLGVQLERLGEKVQQVFLQLLEAGLLDVLESIVDIVDLLAGAFGGVLEVVGAFNDALGGAPVKILAITAAVSGLTKAIQALNIASAVRGITGGAGAAGIGARLQNSRLLTAGATGAQFGASRAIRSGSFTGANFNNTVGSGATAAAFRSNPIAASAGGLGGLVRGLNPALVYAGAGLATAEAFQTYFEERDSVDNQLGSLYEIATTKTQEDIQEIVDGFEYDTATTVFQAITFGKSEDQFKDDLIQATQAPGRSEALNLLAERLKGLNKYQLSALEEALIESFEFKGEDLQRLQDEILGDSQYDPDFEPSEDQSRQLIESLLSFARQDIADNPTADRVEKFFDKFGEETGIIGDLGLLLREVEADGIATANAATEGENKRQRDLEAATERAKSVLPDVERLRAAYNSGRAGSAQYLRQLERMIKTQEQTLSLSGSTDTETADRLRELYAERAKVQSKTVRDSRELNLEFARLDPSFGDQEEVDARISDLDRITDPEELRSAIGDIISLREKILQDRIDNARTAEEAAFIAGQGIALTEDEQIAIVLAQLQVNNEQWAFLMDAYLSGTVVLAEEFRIAIGRAVALGGDSVAEAQEAIDQARDDLGDQLDAFDALPESQQDPKKRQEIITAMLQLAQLEDDLLNGEDFGVERPKRIYGDAAKEQEKAAKDREQKAKQLRDARFEYFKALAGSDQIRVAQLGIQQAQEELAEAARGTAEWYQAAAKLENANRELRGAYEARYKLQLDLATIQGGNTPIGQAQSAIALANYQLANAENEFDWYEAMIALANGQRQLEDAQNDIYLSQLELAQAEVSGDPVRAAQIGIQQANAAIAQARDEASRNRAVAQKIQAERSMVEAVRDIWDAQTELILAQANFAGDTVRASQIGLQQAQARLAQTRQDFSSGDAGQAEVIRAEAELIAAQGALRDSQLQDQLGDFEYLYEMEKITKSQLIQYLQSLKQIPDLTEDQIRDIDRRIKQLNDELGADLQFNLPTSLNLPTLYEARRLNDSAPGGYQDNRTNTFNIVVNGATDTEQVVEMITDATSGSRFGNQVRRY